MRLSDNSAVMTSTEKNGDTWDAIIIGARAAGAPLGMLLARDGYRVLIVERARFPKHTTCTHFTTPLAMAYLRRWGLLDAVAATGAPLVSRGLSSVVGRGHWEWTYPEIDGLAGVYCPQRIVLDALLAEAASAAGADVRFGWQVSDLLVEDGRVTGVLGPTVERARIVVGADGARSLVASRMAPTESFRRAFAGASWQLYLQNADVDALELHIHPELKTSIGACPTTGGLTTVYVATPDTGRPTARQDLQRAFLEYVEQGAPDLGARLREAVPAGPVTVSAKQVAYRRRPYGSGWALVGDAALRQRPSAGHGITDAFRTSDLLAQALHLAWSGRRDLDSALADYERVRDEAGNPLFEAVNANGNNRDEAYGRALMEETERGPIDLQ